jgi:hypothetical protein
LAAVNRCAEETPALSYLQAVQRENSVAVGIPVKIGVLRLRHLKAKDKDESAKL